MPSHKVMLDGGIRMDLGHAQDRIEYFASMLDTFLNGILEAAEAGDRKGTLVNYTRVAVVAKAMLAEFTANAEVMFREGDTESIQAVAEQVLTMLDKHTDKLRAEGGNIKTSQEIETAARAAWDKALGKPSPKKDPGTLN